MEHLCEYIETLTDELRWNESFERTQSQLSASARRASEDIANGHGKPMDYGQL